MLGVNPDGVFGRGTLSALQHFQNTHGLHVTGHTDANTWVKLGTDAPGHAAPSAGVATKGGVTGVASPAGGSNTYQQFAQEVLHGIGAPTTAANVNFIVAWAKREGGGGANNPLNTTLPFGNATDLPNNSAHVKNYASFQDGVTATIKTLEGSAYADIRQAFASGKADPSANYQGLHTWSGGGYSSLAGVNGSDWRSAPVQAGGGGSASGGGSGSFGTGNAPGSPAGNAQFSKQDINSELDNLGLPKALINSDKGLNTVFRQIVKDQIDLSTPAGQDRAMTLFKNTKWWKARSDSQRKFDVLKVDNPGEFGRQLQQKQKDLQTAAASMGIPLNGGDLQAITQLVLRNGLDDTETRHALAQHFAYNPNGKFTGEAGLDIAGVQQIASSYYQNVSDQTLNNLVDNLLTNNMNPQSLQDYFKQLAISKFPHLQKQLEAGQTVSDIADPYKQQMAQRLEVDPNGIKNEDPTVMKALQQPTGKGDFQLMPLWQYDQMLKQDPRWMQTNNARDSLMDAGTSLLRNMGLTV